MNLWLRVAASALLAVGLLARCAPTPTAPSVMVLPGRGKTFEEFQSDDASCRRTAMQTVEAVKGSSLPTQYRFDIVYMQCMYASGHQVPASGGRSGYTGTPPNPPTDVPRPPPGTPPPPPGSAPPPPGSTR